MRWTPDELALAAGGRLRQRGPRPISGVFIDTRAPQRGAVFVPIVAQRNGHDFIEAAIAGGAHAVLQQIGRAIPSGSVSVVEVDDTLAALTRLAQHARNAISGPVVAITGSNGKTSTRALTAAALATRYRPLLCTRGNLNNHLGVPLTLLGSPHDPAAAVIELGMSAPGENAHLAKIVRPHAAIITSLALEHLESMGSFQAIVDAEAEVIPHLQPGGAIIVPENEPALLPHLQRASTARILRFGSTSQADIRIRNVVVGPRTIAELELPGHKTVQISLDMFGSYHALNAAAAMCAALHFGLDPQNVAEALSRVKVVGDRGRWINCGEHALIADCYNANPGSMRAALSSLGALRNHRPGPLIAVLGDMLELGSQEASLHRDLGHHIADLGLDALITVGPRAKCIGEAARDGGILAAHFHKADAEAAAWLAKLVVDGPGATLLFKASRAIALEQLVQTLVSVLSPATAPVKQGD
ncbi:MAG: UDP-N-acetylmuramoyl-tripeptide--D-alanyl-D-alanine ligase [Nannocystaceae bacterium]